MVERSLSQLQTPSSYNLETNLVEKVPEPSFQMNQEQIHEPQQKKSLGQLKTPNTYQGLEDPTVDEGTLEYITRNALANTSRVVEQVGGRYGNIEKFAKDTLTNLPMTGGLIGWALSEMIGPEKWEKMVRGPEGSQQMFPTSQQLKSASQKATGGYTTPKTKGEGEFQEFTEDFGAMLSGPTQPNLTGANAAQRNFQQAYNKIMIPAAANVTKKIVNDLGFGEDKANMAKALVWMPLTLAGNINAPQYASHLMNQGRQGFSNNVRANIPRYDNSIAHTSRNMLQSDPRSALAQQQIAGIYNDMQTGQTSMPDLMRRYDAINAAKRDRGLFALNPGDRRAAIHNINEVRDAVRTEIETLGQINPQALQSWQNGVNAWATIHRSNALTNWVEGLAKGPYAKLLSGPAAALFGIGSIGAAKSPMIAGPLAAIAPALYKTGQVIYRMWNDPILANYYWRSINAAMEENVPAFINNYQKLDKELKKSDSTKPKSKRKEK